MSQLEISLPNSIRLGGTPRWNPGPKTVYCIHESQIFEFSIYANDNYLGLGIERSEYNNTIKPELDKVMQWFQNNHLLANVDKTD